jgi:uncharacterized protein DUF4388
MAETFPVSGNIEPTSFPHLLVDLHRHGATGSLKVNGPLHPKHLYFRAGRIVFGSSKDPRDQLGEILIEGGRISREQLDEVNAKIGPGNPLAKVLAESGFVNQREIQDAARVKLVRILSDVLSWESGSFEFEDGVLPKSAVDLKIPTERLVLEATQRIPDRSFALRHVGMDTVLEPIPGADAPLAEVGADVSPLLEHLNGKRTLKEAISLTRLDEFDAAKTACAILFLGIARKKEPEPGREVDLAEEAQVGLGAQQAPHEPTAATLVVEGLEATGFALAESEPLPSFPEVEPLPEPARATETVAFGLPAIEPEPAPFVQPEPAPFVQPEPAPFVQPGQAPEPFPEVVSAEPRPAPEVPSFETEVPWARKPSDTVPGDQPVYRPQAPQAPQAPEPPPAEPSVPDLGPPPAPASRPTREDLAALDALLSPSASQRLGASPIDRPRPDLSQTLRPPTTPPRRLQARPASSGRSPVSLIAIGLAFILLTSVAAWYFLLRSPKAPAELASASPPPVTEPEAPTPAPTAVPTIEPTASPTAASTATPAPTSRPSPVATPRPTPTPAPTPRPTPAKASRPTGAPQAGEARSLLAQGALPDAARAFAASMAPEARGRFSLQVLVACDPVNVQKAVNAVPAAELFILPVTLKGKACYRLCWGVYDDRSAAEAALSGLPSYFRQGGAAPRLSPLPELLP